MNHFAGWNTALPRSVLIIMPGLLCKGGNMQLTKALQKPQMFASATKWGSLQWSHLFVFYAWAWRFFFVCVCVCMCLFFNCFEY